MTKPLNEALGTKIQIDNTLFDLPVLSSEFNSTEDAVTWLQGIALANNLNLEIVETGLVLKSKDFATHTTLLQGKLNEDFLATSRNMGWDLFPIGGLTIIEYPVAHTSLIQTITKVDRSPYSFEVNISVIDNDLSDKKGFQISNLVSLTSSSFDLLRFKQPITLLNVPSVNYNRAALKFLQDNTITLSLTAMGGTQAIQRLDKTNSVITTSRDALGQSVSQSVTNFTSGFIFKLVAYPANENCIVEIDIEISSDTQKNENLLPEISRKQVINTGLLSVGDVWKCAEFQSINSTNTTQKKFFLPFTSQENTQQTLIVAIKRVT